MLSFIVNYKTLFQRMQHLKEKLLQKCFQTIENQLLVIEKGIAEAQAAANEDTKSSAGDKYETTRAMMQIEIENLSKRLADAQRILQILQQINVQKQYVAATTGAVIATTQGNYFMAVGIGKMTVEGVDFFVISPQSPIGAKLHHTNVHDEVAFNGKKIIINAIY